MGGKISREARWGQLQNDKGTAGMAGIELLDVKRDTVSRECGYGSKQMEDAEGVKGEVLGRFSVLRKCLSLGTRLDVGGGVGIGCGWGGKKRT